MLRKIIGFAVLTGSMIAVVGCTSEARKDSSISILLNWFPDAQHGGFYAASEHGYFQDQGLPNVRIAPGGPGSPVIQNVALGKSDYGIANADQILLARAQGAPVVALMAVMQTSPRCIMVHRASGIESLDQLADVKLAVGAGKAFTKFLQKKLPLDGVTLVNYTGTVAPFLSDPKLAQQAYIFSEPRLVEQNGIEATTLMVSKLGFDPYNTCLFTREDLIATRSEEVGKVVNASRDGWTTYLDDPSKSHKRILGDNSQMDLESLQFGASAIKPLCLPNRMQSSEFGRMQLARWQTLHDQLLEVGLLAKELDVSRAFTNKFLPSVEAAATSNN